jgi:hypothetical protein
VRTLFFALLVANVLFFGWARWIDVPPQTTAPTAQDSSVPTLALARTPAPATAAKAAPVATSPGQRCRSLGPFPDGAAAAAAAVALRARGIEPHNRSAETSVSDGYWVYISDLGDPPEQQRVLARLGRGGIQGTVMIDAGESARVSVGIFSDQSRAVRRAEQVRALGLKPILDLHQRVLRRYWLDMDLRPDQPEPQVAALQGSDALEGGGSAGTAIAFSDCPTTAKRG